MAKMSIFRFSPMLATSSPSTGAMARASSGMSTLSTCLPLRVLATHSSSSTTKPRLARLAEMGPAPAELRRRPERLADFLDFSSDALPLQLLRSEQLFDLGLLLAERLVLALDLDLFELAQIAQPHVENGFGLHVRELETLHQYRLRLVLLADDFDHLVDIQIRDEVAAEDFEAVLDRGEAMPRTALQHVPAVVDPFAQRLGEPDHARHAALHEHVHIERNPAL